MVMALGLYRQQEVLKLQRNITDTTNELLLKNSEKLRQNVVDVAKESQRGIVDIETLKKANANLIETMNEALRIQQDGRQKRKGCRRRTGKTGKQHPGQSYDFFETTVTDSSKPSLKWSCPSSVINTAWISGRLLTSSIPFSRPREKQAVLRQSPSRELSEMMVTERSPLS